jgi:hypothetical protein
MGWHFVTRIPAEHGNRNIAVLDKPATVQPAIEPIACAVRLLRAFRFGSVALPLAQKAKSFPHLRFGFVIGLGIVANRCICRSDRSVLLVLASEILEA